MAWTVEWDDAAVKSLRKLNKQTQKNITHYLKSRIETKDSPRRFGKGLTSNKSGLWRYCVGDYRIICNIEDAKLIVLVVATGHRKSIYI